MLMMVEDGERDRRESQKKVIENERSKVGVTQVNHLPILFK